MVVARGHPQVLRSCAAWNAALSPATSCAGCGNAPVAYAGDWQLLASLSGKRGGGARIGLPIGNLTSQIFANITLHEFDRFVLHILKPRGYIRYGDDFVLFGKNMQEMLQWRDMATLFLRQELGLSLHPHTGGIFPCKKGLRFCGWEIFPHGIRLLRRTWQRALNHLQPGNIASYSGLVRSAKSTKKLKEFHWRSLAVLYEPLRSSS